MWFCPFFAYQNLEPPKPKVTKKDFVFTSVLVGSCSVSCSKHIDWSHKNPWVKKVLKSFFVKKKADFPLNFRTMDFSRRSTQGF